MIKSLIHRLLGKSPVVPAAPPLGKRVEVGPQEHGIDPQLLDDNAVRVVRTLKDGGYEAYVVGGAVRDLLVGRRPKDFDVATNATPEQVKALFRRAFIIGRRFRIVHVVFGRGREHEVIEVSTFRALLAADDAQQVEGNEKTSRAELAGKTHVVDASGRVLRDNVWGPQIEDAARRDFTVNAMYYDPLSRIVVDYHGGLADVRARMLRMIGDPATRYREDPVRLLRAARFAAKLGFSIEKHTLAPVRKMAPLLANVPGSRLFDEMIKLLQTGHAIASVRVLREHGLIEGVFPILEAALGPGSGPAPAGGRASKVAPATAGSQGEAPRERFIRLALEDTDRRVGEGRPVAPSFLLACLLWHEVQVRWQAQREAGESSFPALQQAIDAVFDARIGDISGRGRLAADMREIWQMQPRLERRSVSSVPALVEQPRFRAGFDFLRLRADVDEVPQDLAEWWEDYALGSEEEREALLQELKSSQARRVPAGARAGRGGGVTSPRERSSAAADLATSTSATDGPLNAAAAADASGAEMEGEPSRRKRRRRGGRGRARPEAADSDEGTAGAQPAAERPASD
jgi:poly(A) polymerase